MIVDDMEMMSHSENSSMFQRFRTHLLTKLASMVATYYFKQHKEFLAEFINSEELKLMIAKELAARLTVEIK